MPVSPLNQIMKNEEAVDVVYLWVDGSDAFQNLITRLMGEVVIDLLEPVTTSIKA
jgi:hypothetical protein